MIDGTRAFEVIVVVGFFILLIASVWMLVNFYVCDAQNCKAFNTAKDKADPGSESYVLTLLSEMYNDGIWPIPYIGAACATPLSLWFLGVPMTVRNFWILFLIIFIVIYFMFSFFGHHYIRPITSYVSEYIQTSCPNTLTPDAESLGQENMENTADQEIIEKTIDEELICEQNKDSIEHEVTFATPINIF